MRLTTDSMLQVARDLRIDDRHAAERRRADVARAKSPAVATPTTNTGRSARPTGLRRLISLGLRA